MVDAVLHSLIAMMARVAGAGMLEAATCSATHRTSNGEHSTRTTPRAASSCGQGLLLGCALVSVLVLGCRLGPAPLKLVLL